MKVAIYVANFGVFRSETNYDCDNTAGKIFCKAIIIEDDKSLSNAAAVNEVGAARRGEKRSESRKITCSRVQPSRRLKEPDGLGAYIHRRVREASAENKHSTPTTTKAYNRKRHPYPPRAPCLWELGKSATRHLASASASADFVRDYSRTNRKSRL